MEHPTCVHAVTTKYDKSLKLNRNKHLFMEIAFLSCHVSIKKNWKSEQAAPRPTAVQRRPEVATKFPKTCQPACRSP